MRALVSVLLAWSAIAVAAPVHPPQDGKPCVACHADAHFGEFGRRSCGDCHTLVGFSPSTFDASKHVPPNTKYVLDGKHVATPCSGCHRGGKPRTLFIIASAECLDCHTNPHGEKFVGRKETACGDCHTTAAWKQWKVDHRSWPLQGAHARMACTGCHAGKTIDTPLAAYRGIARTCEGCHADVHASQFATAPRRGCADCHTQERWKTLSFDHANTRYPLEGVHVTMACDACHRTTKLRNGDEAVRWRLGYAQCKDCHANPHPKVVLDCKGCHAATGWKLAGTGGNGFDHDATGFVLRQAHARVACASCHDGKPRAAGARTNATCQSCHADPHKGRLTGQCFECHTAVAWQDVAVFEQHRRTRMPLTGKHALIECSACHRRQGDRTWRDLPTDCYGCHEQDNRAAVGHEAAFHRPCALCHDTLAWAPALTPADIARVADHDRSFVLSTGPHRGASCESCHVDPTRSRAVRCDGCHGAVALRAQHQTSVAPIASTCLRCHPRGARR